MEHIPVLLTEVIAAIEPKDGGRYIDATLGDSGHAKAILTASSPTGKLLGLDQDENQLSIAEAHLQQFKDRVTFRRTNFGHIQSVATEAGFSDVDGILFDLGISSRQLSDAEYGLSFADETVLDMQLSPEAERSAKEIVNGAGRQELADILYKYGDRHDSYRLADRIIAFRRKHPIVTALDLKTALELFRPNQLAPIFQALRIVVNDEYGQIEAALAGAERLLGPGGVLAVISFHSGEDRIVKNFLRNAKSRLKLEPIIVPGRDEQKTNGRSRSAKLRIATRIIN